MDDTVKVGQVWQHKNTGGRWEVTEDGETWVGITRGDGLKAVVQKALIVDDYILVREVP
jgi:hypothetical protein